MGNQQNKLEEENEMTKALKSLANAKGSLLIVLKGNKGGGLKSREISLRSNQNRQNYY